MKILKSNIKALLVLLVASLNTLLFKIIISHIIQKCWRKSTIAIWNLNNNKVPCHYCKSENTTDFHKIDIINGYGLFDKNEKSLTIYYGTWIPKIIWNYLGVLRVGYAQNSSNELKNKHKINYLECHKCGIIFQNYPHVQKNISLYYEKYYRRSAGKTFGRAGSQDGSHAKWKELVASQLMEYVDLPVSSKVLDVGCAEGWFCLALNKFEMSAYGIEPSQSMVSYGQDILKLNNLKCGVYTSSSYSQESFDVIHSFHVMEHILDIDSILNSMSMHIKKNGVLSLSVPCVDQVSNINDLNYTLYFDHIYNFTEKWFRLVLPNYGFKVLKVLLSPFDLEQYGSDHPGKSFSVTPWGDVRGGIWVLAEKI